ncbi:HAD family hydrolase [Oryzibacter oryziterrae]|uniref:HAD family hydrolase n=1 Tax=Oryzibacter oryziterrae TaxID=2766474 RepID=UPI001F25008E|nr:HAD family phosphatase [Oryzibacter oryziterrae]
MTSSPVKLVLFDMDDVVYAYDRSVRVARLAGMTGLDPVFIETAIWSEGLEAAADGGAYPTGPLYLKSWQDRLGYPLAEDQWLAARKAAMTLVPGTLAIIDQLLAAGLAVGVLTNNGPLVHARRHDLVPELAARAGHRFTVSAQFDTKKPDPAVFTRCLEHLGFAPGQTVFIDDMPENAEGASAAGLTGLTYTDPARLAADLRRLGLPV